MLTSHLLNPSNEVPSTAPAIARALVLHLAFFASCPGSLFAAGPPNQTSPAEHAEQAFQDLSRHERQPAPPSQQPTSVGVAHSVSSSEDFLRGTGEGDLSKGRLTCQRVAELAARTDLAKQIRVRVTEHATDRLRERMGKTTEQDIEVVREEMVNELLRDVRIIDKRTDEATGTCSSVAVMPKSRIMPEEHREPSSVTSDR